MRKLSVLFIFIFLFGVSMAKAAEVANVPAAKIGVVDVQTIATESEAAKAAKEQLDKKYGKERDTLEKQGKDLQKQAEALKNPKTTDSKKMSFVKARQKLDNDARNFLRKVEQEEVKLRQEMITLVFSAAYEVARAKGFNFVVDVTGGGVLYADQSMDLTQDVLAEVNRLYNENKNKAEEKPASTEAPATQNKK